MPFNAILRGAVLGVATLLGACAGPQAPGPGEAPATAAVRDPGEQRLGRETHPKILERFGGAYDEHPVAGYVDRLGARIAAVSEQPDAPWTFTVLDTPTVNAFALPGGYVYVTRGLVALADNEAELAGVIGHEIGHVTAGHSALRRERSTMAGLGVLLGGIGLAAAGVDPGLARGVLQAGQAAAGGVLASYSRADELAADNLGVRYLARAGYDPLAQADFLESMSRAQALQARIAGQRYDPNRVDFFASHPATAERTRRAVAVAREGGLPEVAADRGRERFLAAVDGMVWGDNPDQGSVDGRRFLHPRLRFAYEVPRGFTIRNARSAVTATGPGGARLILQGGEEPGGRLTDFVARRWVPALTRDVRSGGLQGLSALRINGLEAAEAFLPVAVDGQRRDLVLVAIRHRGTIYRLTGLAVPGSGALERMRRAARSFRPLSRAEASAIEPKRLRVVTVRPGETVARLARRMDVDAYAEERFRVLNDLRPGEEVRPGAEVKLIR